MKYNLDWYKKPENRDKVEQIVKTIDGLVSNYKYHFGALDYDGSYYIYENEPHLPDADVCKYKEWKSHDGYYAEVYTFEGYYDDWKETLISLDDLKTLIGAEVSPSLDWYKKPENIGVAQKVVDALGSYNLYTFGWGALDADGNFFAYRTKPITSNEKPCNRWKCFNDSCLHIISLHTPVADWKDTLVSLTELKEFVEQTERISIKSSEETASDSPELSVHLRKKLVLEIKEFSNGQCKYLVKESFGIAEADCFGSPVGDESVDYIWSVDSKDELIEDVRKIFAKQEGELAWGKECEVSEDKEVWTTRMFVGKHPIYEGYIVVHDLGLTDQPEYWRYARPIIANIKPTIDGDIYTWEE